MWDKGAHHKYLEKLAITQVSNMSRNNFYHLQKRLVLIRLFQDIGSIKTID